MSVFFSHTDPPTVNGVYSRAHRYTLKLYPITNRFAALLLKNIQEGRETMTWKILCTTFYQFDRGVQIPLYSQQVTLAFHHMDKDSVVSIFHTNKLDSDDSFERNVTK
jgi:hypothetical protein